MECPGRDPHAKVRRDQPHAPARRYLHYPAYRIDELIGTMSMLGYLETARILIGQRRNRNAAPGIILGNEALSQERSCDNLVSGSSSVLWLNNSGCLIKALLVLSPLLIRIERRSSIATRWGCLSY